MKGFTFLSLGLAFSTGCASDLPCEDISDLQVDTTVSPIVFSWTGKVGHLTVETGEVTLEDSSPERGESVWDFRCEEFVDVKDGATIYENCISGPITFGELPSNADESIEEATLVSGDSYTARVGQYCSSAIDYDYNFLEAFFVAP